MTRKEMEAAVWADFARATAGRDLTLEDLQELRETLALMLERALTRMQFLLNTDPLVQLESTEPPTMSVLFIVRDGVSN
jgi:hypothetical protein